MMLQSNNTRRKLFKAPSTRQKQTSQLFFSECGAQRQTASAHEGSIQLSQQTASHMHISMKASSFEKALNLEATSCHRKSHKYMLCEKVLTSAYAKLSPSVVLTWRNLWQFPSPSPRKWAQKLLPFIFHNQYCCDWGRKNGCFWSRVAKSTLPGTRDGGSFELVWELMYTCCNNIT